MVVCVLFFFFSYEVPEWVGAQWTLVTGAFEIHLHLSSAAEWALAIAPECFSWAVGNQREHMWLLLEALFDGLAQLDAFLSRALCFSASHCTSWTLTPWRAGVLLLLLCRWSGMVVFFSGVGRIFVQDEGNWTAWVSSIWERKLILGRLK